jgi:SAM-dependent methyltransferase
MDETPRENLTGRSNGSASRDPKFAEYTARRVAHWESVWSGRRPPLGARYRARVREVYRHLVLPGSRVLEIGCGEGDLLAALAPRRGVGIDFSPTAIAAARRRHPGCEFFVADAHDFALGETFDYVVLADLVNDVWDIQALLTNLAACCTPRTRVVLNYFSHLWQPSLSAARALRLATPLLQQNWVDNEDVANLLQLAGFERLRHSREVLAPLGFPLLSDLLDRYVVRLWPISRLALTNFVVARPSGRPERAHDPTVSVVVPARNEAGNIRALFERVPELGAGTELVFVEGGSGDDTVGEIERSITAHPEREAVLLRQIGRGKGDAVRLGFAHASGDILIILDADLSVAPEDLPRFVAALRDGRAEFANGVRLVYPREAKAMRFLNMVANKLFGAAFSWVLDRPIKDTLCGTKALWREDYRAIERDRRLFGDFDPFGDFDLLVGAARRQLKFADIPVRYAERTYGRTNIRRWSDGWMLARMLFIVARRLKWV